MGHADCAAPSDWAKTPDRCAPPPLETRTAPPATSSTPSDSPVAKVIGQERYQAIKHALTHAFPDAKVDDDVIAGVDGVLRAQPGKPPGGGADTMERAPITRHVVEKEHHLYLGQADHHRVKGMSPASASTHSEFMLELPMVRVALPDKLTTENTVLATEIGDVDFAKDHLLGSVDLIASKYGGAGYLGARPARVDLITPVRSVKWRFGAIAVYLGYLHTGDRSPSFYLLEAGTATGDAKMIYFSPSMKPISNVTSYYLPTPFVTMRNTYSGGITMQAPPHEDEPQTLLVESRVPGEKDPYITVTVTYRRAPELDLPMPIELTADAGARVALIAKAMGVPSGEPLEGVLADLARTFHWIEIPHQEPTTSPTSTAAP